MRTQHCPLVLVFTFSLVRNYPQSILTSLHHYITHCPLISRQINLKSCCVVPEELSVFAKEKAITLYTHSDPSELLPGDCLR